jgi:phosphomevalonate kinase
VLDGAPAVVAAVDRYAVADTSRKSETPPPELRAALSNEARVPYVDVRSLQDGHGRKLGLGSSAAALVAALGACALERGQHLDDAAVRADLFRMAKEAHARAQGGGSGVDVAASVYGGVCRYTLQGTSAEIRSIDWPRDLVLGAYFAGSSARTSELLARLAARRTSRPQDFARHALAMDEGAREACEALEAKDADRFLAAARSFGSLLARLGRLADAPIVPAAVAELAAAAEREGGAFLVSGAGGGDVAVWLGKAAPSKAFAARAASHSFAPLTLCVDRGGVRSDPPSS